MRAANRSKRRIVQRRRRVYTASDRSTSAKQAVAMKGSSLLRNVRKFINGSFGIFTEVLREDTSALSADDLSLMLLEQCGLFRKELVALEENIDSIAAEVDAAAAAAAAAAATASSSSSAAPREEDSWGAECDYVCHIEKAWHICEIFLLNPSSDLSLDMLKWFHVSTSRSTSRRTVILSLYERTLVGCCCCVISVSSLLFSSLIICSLIFF
jgi:hypothetical protein